MHYTPRNNDSFVELLDFYTVLMERLEGSGIEPILYGSLSYMYFTGDDDITISDIDLIAPEATFSHIIEHMRDAENVTCELTEHNSLRVFRNGAKLSIHSQEKARTLCDLTSHVVKIHINGVDFLSLDRDALILFYKFSIESAKEVKVGYQEKFQKLLEAKYGKNHTFFMLKPSTLERKDALGEPIYLAIIQSILQAGFTIISQKKIHLSSEDVEYIYQDEYEYLIPILGEENVKRAMEVNKKLYSDKTVLFLVAEKENAVEDADRLKGDSYWPRKCDPDSLRYIFRDTRFDDLEMPAGTIVDVPCDNLIHCPGTLPEFYKIAGKWLV